MNVGLPGTGIGGLFYLLTTFLILVIELVETLKGKSTRKKWTVVAEQTALTTAMIVVAILTNMVVSRYLIKKTAAPVVISDNVFVTGIHIYERYPILVPFTLLFLVLFTIQIVSLFLRKYPVIKKAH